MRFSCGPTRYEENRRLYHKLKEWHKWFAWYPVRLDENQCAWLETIERKYNTVYFHPEDGTLEKRNPIYR